MFPKITTPLLVLAALFSVSSSIHIANKVSNKVQAKQEGVVLYSTIVNGEQLEQNTWIVSPNNQYALVVLADMNVCVFAGSAPGATDIITSSNINNLLANGFTTTWCSNTA